MEALADTDDSFAFAKADMLRSEILAKRTRSRMFLVGSGSVEARKAEAETHAETCAADDALIAAITKFERLKAERQRAELLIDVWRSIEASRRRL